MCAGRCCDSPYIFTVFVVVHKEEMGFFKKLRFWRKRRNEFQNKPTKMDASKSTGEPQCNDAATLTEDVTMVDVSVSTSKPPQTRDCATSTMDLTTETRYVMTTNQSMKIKS